MDDCFLDIRITRVFKNIKWTLGVTAVILFHLLSGGGLSDRKEEGGDETPSFFRVILVLLGTLSVFFLYVFCITSLIHAWTGLGALKQIAIFDWKWALPLLFTYHFVWEFLKLTWEWIDEL
jgi:hypothetical protein